MQKGDAFRITTPLRKSERKIIVPQISKYSKIMSIQQSLPPIKSSDDFTLVDSNYKLWRGIIVANSFNTQF